MAKRKLSKSARASRIYRKGIQVCNRKAGIGHRGATAGSLTRAGYKKLRACYDKVGERLERARVRAGGWKKR